MHPTHKESSVIEVVLLLLDVEHHLIACLQQWNCPKHKYISSILWISWVPTLKSWVPPRSQRYHKDMWPQCCWVAHKISMAKTSQQRKINNTSAEFNSAWDGGVFEGLAQHDLGSAAKTRWRNDSWAELPKFQTSQFPLRLATSARSLTAFKVLIVTCHTHTLAMQFVSPRS